MLLITLKLIHVAVCIFLSADVSDGERKDNQQGDAGQDGKNHECMADRAHCRVPPVSRMPSMKSLPG